MHINVPYRQYRFFKKFRLQLYIFSNALQCVYRVTDFGGAASVYEDSYNYDEVVDTDDEIDTA